MVRYCVPLEESGGMPCWKEEKGAECLKPNKKADTVTLFARKHIC